MRSRTGCLTCRNRKLKCDEGKPRCKQCTKANRDCVPSPGVVFRHQQNASMNGDSSNGGQNNLKSFYGYKETFDKDSIWVDIPKQLTFVHTTNPYEDGDIQESNADPILLGSEFNTTTYPYSYLQGPTHGLEALSAAASGDHYYQSSSRHMNQLDSFASEIDPRLSTELSETITLFDNVPGASDLDSKTDEDVPFLLRYFSEGPGEWMDLFDLGSFFAVDVPLKATYCPLLLYAAIALSAKALGRIRITAQHPKSSGSKRTPADWSHKARFYYDQAISLLRMALEHETRRPSVRVSQTSPLPSEGGPAENGQTMSPTSNEQIGNNLEGLPRADSDELVATTAILCVFEFLDGSGQAWARHLEGAKSLFDIAKDGTVPLPALSPSRGAESPTPRSQSTRSRRAVFWNICRQEMLSAFINNTCTRLDTVDLPMWRSAGLHISPSGYILPSNDPAIREPMTDDMISNALIWLMMKLVNFIAAGDDFPDELGLGIRQTQLLEYWEGLEKQLDVWFEGLPSSFRPSATEWPDKGNTNSSRKTSRVPKKWFARPLCASTMQSFHFAKIQLLLNKPHISTGASHTGSPSADTKGTTWSLAQRHASYASILRQSRKHAEEIVSIGLGLNNDGARIHSVQPLYTAGQVLGMREGTAKPSQTEADVPDETDEIRGCILNLLQNIQRETGWATEYRMQQLLEEWSLPTGQS